mmetsp:Transcript_34079/g.54540  ORF Transcript_34079/g.54540 Transcript_34079/m.54540 type:complete len:81 (+) Transcript_34079:2150-2392(+)
MVQTFPIKSAKYTQKSLQTHQLPIHSQPLAKPNKTSKQPSHSTSPNPQPVSGQHIPRETPPKRLQLFAALSTVGQTKEEY